MGCFVGVGNQTAATKVKKPPANKKDEAVNGQADQRRRASMKAPKPVYPKIPQNLLRHNSLDVMQTCSLTGPLNFD